MKYIPVIFICVLGIAACHKSDVSPGGNNGSRLTSIVSDSAGTLVFGYTNNLITTLKKQRVPDTARDLATIHYANPDADQLVTITFPGDDYTYNYKLKSSKLPLLIFINQPDSDIHQTMAQFIYVPGTDILDSVIYGTMNQVVVFKFTYNGQNITRITEWQISDGQNTQVGAFDFTYDTTANIFRQTDPLLYIYSYPFTAFFAQPMVIASFFAETFSASTFNGVTTSGITTDARGQIAISTKMTYHLNSNGKITSETFSNDIFEGLAGKRYVYE